MDGLIKCSIVPPERLCHPVVPFRCNKKLLFCLCRSCVLEHNISEQCTHTADVQRTLTGTWVIDEVRLAVEKGYKVLEIYELYEYQITQYKLAKVCFRRLYKHVIETKGGGERISRLVQESLKRRAIY